MKGKPIRVDWDDLEAAFDDKNEELVYYLDTVTGHVHLEGEGEDDPFDFDDDDEVSGPTSPPPEAAPTDDATRVYVERPDAAIEVGWIRKFVDGAGGLDGPVAERAREALGADDPLDAFRELLREHDDERDRWFRYRSDRIHEYIDSWLDSHGIIPAKPAPWK